MADDLSPELHGPERAPQLERLSAALAARSDLVLTGLPWGSGLIVAARRG